MSPAQILVYLGGAAAYAAALTLLLAGLARLAGRRLGAVPLVLSALFVVFLGLHPFPDPAGLDCSGGGPRPLLRPFGFLDAYVAFWRSGKPLAVWLRSLSILAPAMNVVFFAGVGLALARETRSAGLALAFALALTLFIELAQLTGLFGLYPCPYRHFEIDDLILNVGGVLLGFAAGRLRIRRLSGRGPAG